MSHTTSNPILYADMAAYSKPLRADGEDARQKLAHFKETMRIQVEPHGGKVLQIQRDNCLAPIELAVDALHWGEVLQRLFQSYTPVPNAWAFTSAKSPCRTGTLLGKAYWLLPNSNAWTIRDPLYYPTKFLTFCRKANPTLPNLRALTTLRKRRCS